MKMVKIFPMWSLIQNVGWSSTHQLPTIKKANKFAQKAKHLCLTIVNCLASQIMVVLPLMIYPMKSSIINLDAIQMAQ